MTPAHHRLVGQSGASSSEDVAAAAATYTPAGRRLTSPLKDALWRSGSLRHSPVSSSAPSLSTGVGAPEGRAERWSVKQLFCVASTAVDNLPESLV